MFKWHSFYSSLGQGSKKQTFDMTYVQQVLEELEIQW